MTHRTVLSLVVCLMSIALGGQVLAHDLEPEGCRWEVDVSANSPTVFDIHKDASSHFCSVPAPIAGVPPTQWTMNGRLWCMIFTPAHRTNANVLIGGTDDRHEDESDRFSFDTQETGFRRELRTFEGSEGDGRARCSAEIEGPAGDYTIRGLAGVHARSRVDVTATIVTPSGIWQADAGLERAYEAASSEGWLFPGGFGAWGFSVNFPIPTTIGERSGSIPAANGDSFIIPPLTAQLVYLVHDCRVSSRTSLESRVDCTGGPFLGSDEAKVQLRMDIRANHDLDTWHECD